ncbi:MinD/ParA family protein [Peribacillus huizhouensis]|uniref:Flagellar biosynthesis protein FlhG n=1 Tax=Peribacillus huizhouensis TaxID=1501239 RepID=A0ABR6CIK8_9BACI|nr:MinD/ParA family protein [Peribacillus huizhouensis]MBA9024850.1 flagellar biosynthesis protein FlhG [Peribacillus huizhouensis]
MHDQAENLRNFIAIQEQSNVSKTMAVISGKGGVGKSNFSVNFAINLAGRGKRVLLFDMDIGMGNIDILLGYHSNNSIMDFFNGSLTIKETISSGPNNISIIAGGTGLTNLFSLDDELFNRFTEQFNELLQEYDFILFDMGAGINEDTAKLLLCVDELIVITTPEPTSITDAYSVMKYLHSVNSDIPFHLICNRVGEELQGKETMNRLQTVMRKFLQKEIIPLGYLPDDRTVMLAVSKQIPFILYEPSANISKALIDITSRYLNHSFSEKITYRQSHFLLKIKRFFLGR